MPRTGASARGRDSSSGRGGGPSREFVQGLQRGFAVVKAFGAGSPRLTIAQVAERTGLTRAVARRYLLTLDHLGFAIQQDHQFALTPRVLDLGFTYLSTLDVANVAQPFMERVVEALRESCSVSVLDGTDVVVVARVSAKRIMTINLGVGARLPAHTSSMGKVLLAHLPPADLDAYFSRATLEPHTPRTISDESTLRRMLQTVKARGWASSDEEAEAGVRSVAAALFDRTHQVRAAMSIAGHSSRVTMDELHREHLPVLIDAALQVSRALGAQGSAAMWALPTPPAAMPRLAGAARRQGGGKKRRVA